MELPTAWQIFTDLGRGLSILMTEEKKPVYSCEPALDEKKSLTDSHGMGGLQQFIFNLKGRIQVSMYK